MDASKADTIPASFHFSLKEHIFNREATFIRTEQIRKNTLGRETKKKLLKQTENFSILKLKTLNPKGIYQELNK